MDFFSYPGSQVSGKSRLRAPAFIQATIISHQIYCHTFLLDGHTYPCPKCPLLCSQGDIFKMQKFVVTCPLTLIPHPPSIALRIETKRSGSQPQGPLVVDSLWSLSLQCICTCVFLCQECSHVIVHQVYSSGNQLNHHLLKEAFSGSLTSPGFSYGAIALSYLGGDAAFVHAILCLMSVCTHQLCVPGERVYVIPRTVPGTQYRLIKYLQNEELSD